MMELAQDCLLWYYRDKSSNEIDLVMESDGQLHPLEIKRSVNPGSELVGTFSILDKRMDLHNNFE